MDIKRYLVDDDVCLRAAAAASGFLMLFLGTESETAEASPHTLP